ncbi:MAG: prolyl oligopeptidase family serine peptidase [Acidobacteriia bacterium]|nr:prolyl oligopeptidase family serine peptidase [Terriglobia bacterium]
MRRGAAATAALVLLLPAVALAQEPDPYQWLEEIEGAKAVAWVKDQNVKSQAELEAVPLYKPIFAKSLEIFDSEARIPYPDLKGRLVYNFWQDKAHERGIWRRTTIDSYRTPEPAWETVLDVDALSKAENETWVFKGAECLPPEYRRCMVSLSRGGGDAVVQREFDAETKSFVNGGFALAEAKSSASFRDKDTLWVATDFGTGTLTSSGYPRIVKLWKRGTPLAEARTVFEGKQDEVGAGGGSVFNPEGRYDVVVQDLTAFTSRVYIVLDNRLVRLAIPEDASLKGIFRDHVLFSLRTDWKPGDTAYHQGALLAARLDDLLQDRKVLTVLFEPTERCSLDEVSHTRDRVLITTLDNVRGKLYRLALSAGAWTREEVPLPGRGNVGVAAASEEADLFFFNYQDFLTPSSLFLAESGSAEKVKSLPAFFNAEGMRIEQYEAASKDGTKIPYFVVTPKGYEAGHDAPTLLYAYGGFEVSMVPSYSGTRGAAWLERGGVYVLANIRGGGEFGPRWHLAGMKENRIKTHEDLVAVAEDLVTRKITTSRHLGVEGGSNGGLLVGTAFTLRPDLFHAVVCQVPLLDMKRYSKLLAGASWMDEYGNPEKPEDWAYMKTWSPYQLVKKDVQYPKVFFWTTTRDDRVHPGHARKMVAKMLDMGHPVLYFENIEGGHGSGAVNKQRATTTALEYAYLWEMLK